VLKAKQIVILAALFISGFSALVLEVILQKYLTYIVGSESLSISLVVGVFLASLASGYVFFGRLSTGEFFGKRFSFSLFKIFGYCELTIAFFCLLFPTYFLTLSNFYSDLQHHFLFDFLIALLLVFPAAFLMGASIPLLTRTSTHKNLSVWHYLIYAFNTIGGSAGVLVAGFFFISHWGLEKTLHFISLLCFFNGFLFSFILKPTENVITFEYYISNNIAPTTIKILAFLVGATTVGFEVLLFRIFNLTVGPNVYVFPMVLGWTVFGLGLGSLSLRKLPMKFTRLPSTLLAALSFLLFNYLCIPFWPYWVAHIRFSLAPIDFSFRIYLICIFLFLGFFIFPVFYFLGRALPLLFSLTKKKTGTAGRVVGSLFFWNTMGNIVGALGIGYLLYFFFNLSVLLKLVMILNSYLLLLTLSPLRKWKAWVLLLPLLILLIPNLNRTHHIFGLFRLAEPTPDFFKKFISTDSGRHSVFFEDGPNTTVVVTQGKAPDQTVSHSLFVNGKSDGDSEGDFSTTSLLGLLPYLYVEKEKGLRALVIGLGTGTTSGLLGRAKNIDSVKTLEISSFVKKAQIHFKKSNYDLLNNKKHELINVDAFQFLTSPHHGRFDLIISEPSNPWVTGVENLFTPEFYKKAKNSLAKNGLFTQWFHTYEMSSRTFSQLFKNISSEFKYINVFSVGDRDLCVIMSEKQLVGPHLNSRFYEIKLNPVFSKMSIFDPTDLKFLHLFDGKTIGILTMETDITHSLDKPTLAANTFEDFFLRKNLDITKLIPNEFQRFANESPLKSWDLDTLKKKALVQCKNNQVFLFSFCRTKQNVYISLKRLANPDVEIQLKAYNILRHLGILKSNPIYLKEIENVILADKKNNRIKSHLDYLIEEYTQDLLEPEVKTILERIQKLNLYSDFNVATAIYQKKKFMNRIQKMKIQLELKKL